MSQTDREKCIDPTVGRLVEDELSGALMKPGRQQDHKRFAEHIDKCRSCRDRLLDDANETVLFPELRRMAEERGVSFDEMLEAFGRKVAEMKSAGKLRSKWDE
jgi:hypothetical protein